MCVLVVVRGIDGFLLLPQSSSSSSSASVVVFVRRLAPIGHLVLRLCHLLVIVVVLGATCCLNPVSVFDVLNSCSLHVDVMG